MSILAFAEQRGGALRQAASETVTAGRVLADAMGVELTAVLLGQPSMTSEPEKLGRYGADRVLLGSDDAYTEYVPRVYVDAVASAVSEIDPKVILFPASSLGKDLAPRVAARLKAGLASDCTEVRVEDGRIVAVRPAYGGKVYVTVAFKGEPAVLSIRPRAYMAEEAPRDAVVKELSTLPDPSQALTKVHMAADAAKERPDVAEAEIIVAGGRGLQEADKWSLLEDLADALGPGAALGASRAVVDAGWRPHDEQVGQTGKVVSPPLYFAVGISGAIQHLAGMRTAKCIVAVNKDPEAPIFKAADYGIVGDVFEVLPRLTEEIRKLRSED
jgi:electron transfer flavoprotein alpha subunit